jgi:hypothetical protein
MARGCHGRLKKAENKKKNWKETAKDRRTWRDLAEKAKTHKGLYCLMMMMTMMIRDYSGAIAFFSLLFQVQRLRANWPGPVEISF